MGTYVVLAFTLLVAALLSRSGARSQSPSLTEFAAFCNEIGASGGAPNPFIEVLCRQVAERTDIATQPPPNPAALNVSEAAPNATADQATTLLTPQAEQVTVKQANDSGVNVQESNHTSDSQSRGNETHNVDNGVPGANNVTDTFRVDEGQSVIILNNTSPQEQIDLEVSGGSDLSSNVDIATRNRSTVELQTKLIHIEPHNVSTFHVGERAQIDLVDKDGRNGTNSTRVFQAPVTNLKTLKRGDQMPVAGNDSAIRENSRNQTFKNTETIDQLPQVETQQTLAEGGLTIQQSDIQNSNETLNINSSTDIPDVLDKEQSNIAAHINNATEDSKSEGQVYVEQKSTSETEAPVSTEVATDGLYYLSGNNITEAGTQGSGRASTENRSPAQSGIQVAEVSNSTEAAANVRPEPVITEYGSNTTDELSEIQPTYSQNISSQEFDTIEPTTEKSFEQVGTETNLSEKSGLGNEQSLGSDQETNGGQLTANQFSEGVAIDSAAVDMQSVQGTANYTPTVELQQENVATTESTIYSTESVVIDTQDQAFIREESKAQPSVILEENSVNYNHTGINPIAPSSNLESKQNPLSNHKNESRSVQETLFTETPENADNRAKNSTSESAAVDVVGNIEVTVTTGFATQQMNHEASLPEGVTNSILGIKSSTQSELAGSTSGGSTSQVALGESASEGNPVVSTSLPASSAGSNSQSSVGVSSSEGNSLLSTSLPTNPAGSTSQPSVEVSVSEGNPVASASLPPNPAVSTSQSSAGVSASEGNSLLSTSLSSNPAGSTSQSSVEVSVSGGNQVASATLPPNPAATTSQSSAGVSSSEGNSVASSFIPPNPAGSITQPSVGASSSEGNSLPSTSLQPNPTGSTSQSSVGASSSEWNPVVPTSLPPTPEGDLVRYSILLLKELSTRFLEGLAEIHCRQSVNDFWKKVTDVFRRVSASHKPTVRDMTSSVTEVIESYRRENPYWKTIAAELEEATSDSRWRQLVESLAGWRRGDLAARLRLVSASRQLREAVRAAVSSPECRLAGAQPAADSCSQFVLCYRAGWRWRSLTLSCPRGSAFSSVERRCVWWPLASCTPAPSFARWDDDDGDSDSVSDIDSDSDSDSDNSEDRSWSLFGHAPSLFRMFDFRH